MYKRISLEEIEKRTGQHSLDIDLTRMLSDMNQKLAFSFTNYPDKFANIFVIGLMRSGTTLLSQLLTKYTDLGYINNLVAKFWENPQYGIALAKSLNLFRRDNIKFSSTHGNTSSIDNVHEFGYFWADLLNQMSSPDLSQIEHTDKINRTYLKDKVLSVNHAFGNSCVFKNTLIGHYAQIFNEIFAFPIFIYIKRNPLNVAKSILKVRRERYGDVNEWWSMKPKEYPQLKHLNPCEQVVAQLYYLEKDIEEQLLDIPEHRIIKINYEDLVKSPKKIFEELEVRMEKYGLKFNWDCKIEDTLQLTNYISCDDIESSTLKKHIEAYFGLQVYDPALICRTPS